MSGDDELIRILARLVPSPIDPCNVLHELRPATGLKRFGLVAQPQRFGQEIKSRHKLPGRHIVRLIELIVVVQVFKPYSLVNTHLVGIRISQKTVMVAGNNHLVYVGVETSGLLRLEHLRVTSLDLMLHLLPDVLQSAILPGELGQVLKFRFGENLVVLPILRILLKPENVVYQFFGVHRNAERLGCADGLNDARPVRFESDQKQHGRFPKFVQITDLDYLDRIVRGIVVGHREYRPHQKVKRTPALPGFDEIVGGVLPIEMQVKVGNDEHYLVVRHRCLNIFVIGQVVVVHQTTTEKFF